MARHAHALTIPPYSEVTRVDKLLEETWSKVPVFMKVKPLEESVTDPVIQVIQRFGLTSLYLKSRCVLHRRYLSEVVPEKEHAYSRRAGIEAALAFLDHQYTLYHACLPGALLSTNGWFLSSLAINDFLLADMIVALVLQNEHYPEAGGNFDCVSQGSALPTKGELLQTLRRSYNIWIALAQNIPDCRKAADVVQRILGRVFTQLGIQPDVAFLGISPQQQTSADVEAESMAGLNLYSGSSSDPSMGSSGGSHLPSYDISPDFDMISRTVGGVMEGMQVEMDSDPSWMMHGGSYDWVSFPTTECSPYYFRMELLSLLVTSFGEISDEGGSSPKTCRINSMRSHAGRRTPPQYHNQSSNNNSSSSSSSRAGSIGIQQMISSSSSPMVGPLSSNRSASCLPDLFFVLPCQSCKRGPSGRNSIMANSFHPAVPITERRGSSYSIPD